jgi:molybdate transport system substrate-binding protein
MRFERRLSALAVAMLLVIGVAACGGDDDDDTPPAAVTATTVASPTSASAAATPADPRPTASAAPALEGELTVFAAASLTDAFAAMQARLEDTHPDLAITFNFGSSAQLATQLAEGAGGEVFASANLAQMTVAQEAGVIAGAPVTFVFNRLVIIVPADNPAGISEPGDLASEGVKLVTTPEEVPIGQYTRAMLDTMSADPAHGADFRARVEANIVSLEENVRAVVTKVQLGEADAGVVYLSDVTPDVAADLAVIEVPEEFNVIAEYPIAAVEGGNAELARAFIDFVLSADGQAILEAWGFTPVESRP